MYGFRSNCIRVKDLTVFFKGQLIQNNWSNYDLSCLCRKKSFIWSRCNIYFRKIIWVVFFLILFLDSSEEIIILMSASMTIWMYSVLIMRIRCQKIRLNGIYFTWWTLMATAPVIIPPKDSRDGSATGLILPMDHWSSQKNSNSLLPSH